MEMTMIADAHISAQTAIIPLTNIGSMCVVSTDITTTAPTAGRRWMVMGMREKLIELLESAESAVYWNSSDEGFIEKIADYQFLQ